MDRLKQIESRYNASLEVSEEDFEWLIEKVKTAIKDAEELFESLQIARIGRRDLMAYAKQLQEELIEAYQKRGDMYFAGEKEWIDNRIKELNSQIQND